MRTVAELLQVLLDLEEELDLGVGLCVCYDMLYIQNHITLYIRNSYDLHFSSKIKIIAI